MYSNKTIVVHFCTIKGITCTNMYTIIVVFIYIHNKETIGLKLSENSKIEELGRRFSTF